MTLMKFDTLFAVAYMLLRQHVDLRYLTISMLKEEEEEEEKGTCSACNHVPCTSVQP